MYRPVPRNSLQSELNRTRRDVIAPDAYGERTAACRIKKVYDSDTMVEGDVPDRLLKTLVRRQIEGRPEFQLYAIVVLEDGKTELFLPFKESANQIYSTYGNSVLLEGQPATIFYRSNNVTSGSIVPNQGSSEISLPLETLSKTYDIMKLV